MCSSDLFEKRVTALIASRVAPENLDGWARGLWRAAVSCVAITLLCGAWTFFSPATTNATDLSQNFETTLLEIEDRSVKEISKLTGWSVPLVKVRAFRARAEMRKIVSKMAKHKYL